MPGVFLSYRRDDAAGYAGRLHEALERRLGRDAVFRDIDALEPGQDFVQAIEERLREARVVLVLIGREWLDAVDAAGRRRLDQPHDYVRIEIAGALARPDVRVVPVLIEGAVMPPADRLPDELQPLVRRHAVSLRDDAWDHDVERLAAAIDRAARGPDARSGSAAVPWVAGGAIGRGPSLLLAAAAVAALAIAAAVWLWGGSPRDQSAGAPATNPPAAAAVAPGAEPAPSGGAEAPGDLAAVEGYAVPVPPVAEVAHPALIYTLLSASMIPSGGDTSELRLRIGFTNDGSSPAGVWDGSFRLVSGGRTYVPTGGLNEVVPGRASIERIVTFAVPSDTGRGVLRVLEAERTAEIPLDLSPSGKPPADERAAEDAASRAVVRALTPAPRLLLRTPDLRVVVERASSRRFVNALRLSFSLRLTNTGPSPGVLPTLRLAAGDRVLAPVRAPFILVQPDSDADAEVEFEVPPDTPRVALRALGETSTGELAFELP